MLVLRLARQLAVRTAKVLTLCEQTVVESHAGQRSVERETAACEGMRATDVPVDQRSAHTILVARCRVSGLHREHGGEGLTVLAAIATQREVDALEEERREAPTDSRVGGVGAVGLEHVHAVDKRLALVALAATHIEPPALAHHLCAGQRLQSCHDVATGVASHHHVERIHRLEALTLAKAEGAGRHHHLIDGCGALSHANGETGHTADVGCQRVVVETDETNAERRVASLLSGERETSERVGQAPVDAT